MSKGVSGIVVLCMDGEEYCDMSVGDTGRNEWGRMVFGEQGAESI